MTPPVSLQLTEADIARFISKVNTQNGPDACWIWTGYRAEKGLGHGTMRIRGRMVKAHRVAFTIWRGRIPDGLNVLHECDNPPCCNPRHLFVGTLGDNNRDRHVKGRSGGLFDSSEGHPAKRQRGEIHWSAKLSAKNIATIRERWEEGELQKDLAREFGVHSATISRIVRRIRRQEVP